MTIKTKWLLAGIVLLLAAMLAYAAAGPYLAINGIRNVVARGDYGELVRFVDFEKLRDSVTPQIQQRIAGGIIGRMGHGTTSDLVSGVTTVIAEPAIDAMVSPLGIATLLRGSALAKRLSGEVAAGERPKALDPLKDAKTRFESLSMFTATVESADGKPLVFEFTRSGLAWKLTGLRLPD
jgi:hypothetical protein